MKMWQIPDDVLEALHKPLYLDGQEVLYTGDEQKCGGCNWEVGKVYMLGETLDDAIAAFKENNRGLCGDCIAQMLAECGYSVTAPAPS